jgi:porphobilinogen synthase
MRDLVRETRVSPRQIVAPLFVCAGRGVRREIPSMPGCHVESVDRMLETAHELASGGVGGVLLFGVARHKDEGASDALDADAAVPAALRALRDAEPDLVRWADVCLCAYTDHGHCGRLVRRPDGTAVVDNDSTLPLLAGIAVAYARAGADVVAPSDMMDGRVGHLRTALDSAGLDQTAICAYAVKYASAFYGPFREAAQSAPAVGDRRTYQMDPANAAEAVREAALDAQEGADFILVKPALGYLDVVRTLKSALPVPIVAYSVSGEYAMVKAAAARGWLDERAAIAEMLVGMRRAGADVIVTYFAREAVSLLG